MPFCASCKLSTHFQVHDSLRYCDQCGAPESTSSILPTAKASAKQFTKQTITEKITKKLVAETQSTAQHIEANWGHYLEAFQQALRESVSSIQQKLLLDASFESKVKFFWFEYLRIFRENRQPLIGFFTMPRKGFQPSSSSPNLLTMSQKASGSRYRQKLSQNDKNSIDIDSDLEELDDSCYEARLEDSIDNSRDFVEKILKRKATQEQQQKVISDNTRIKDIFRLFEDVYSIASPIQPSISSSRVSVMMESPSSMAGPFYDTSTEPVFMNKGISYSPCVKATQQQKTKQSFQNMGDQLDEETSKVEKKSYSSKKLNEKRKAVANWSFSYIENKEKGNKDFFMSMLECSDEYVKKLYNGFRSAYFHMLYLQEPDPNPLKRIKRVKESSRKYSITKGFVLRQIEQRRIGLEIAQVDVFHLIWVNDWVEFLSENSSYKFERMEKPNMEQFYEYLQNVQQKVAESIQQNEEKETRFIELMNSRDESKKQQDAKKNENKKTKLDRLLDLYVSSQECESKVLLNDETPKHFDEEIDNIFNDSSSSSSSSKVFEFTDEQMLVLRVVLDEILTERELLSQTSQTEQRKPVQRKKRKSGTQKKQTVLDWESNNNQDDSTLVSLQYNLIPTIIYLALHSIGEPYTPQDVYHWMKTGLFAYTKGISAYIQVTDPKQYWLTPPTIPSSDFIRINAKNVSQMIGIPIQFDGQRFFAFSLRLARDFRLPLEWAAMMYIIGVKGILKNRNQGDQESFNEGGCDQEQQEKEEEEDELALECDIQACAALVLLLKMTYGLNDEMFALLLNGNLINDAKDKLDVLQQRLLETVWKHLQSIHFMKPVSFYTRMPSFKQVAVSIATCVMKQKQEMTVELNDYKQMSSVSITDAMVLLDSFMMETTAECKGNKAACEDQEEINEVPFIVEVENHLSMYQEKEQSQEVGGSNASFTIVTETVEVKGSELLSGKKVKQKFSGCLTADLEYMSSQVIKRGKSVIPPCFDYELEKKSVSGGTGLSIEMGFVIQRLSEYLGYADRTEKLLNWVCKMEGKICSKVVRSTKLAHKTGQDVSLFL